MAKIVHDDVLDGALDIIALATRLDICSQQPTTRTEAITTYTLGNVTLTAGDGNGDYTITNGTTSGRKLTVLAQTIASATGTGNGTHIALTDGTRLLYVTTMTSQAITTGNEIAVGAWDIELRDPT